MPQTDSEVLETLPFRPTDATAREMAGWRATLKTSPTDVAAATALAQRYFEVALAQGDPRHVGHADAVLARFPEPLPPSLRLIRGQLRQYRHQFEPALADFASVLAQTPGLAAAHAWRGAIFLVQARYPQAREECEALARQGRPVLADGCLGLTWAYTGQLAQARNTLERGLAASEQPDQRLWLHTRLGEVAQWQGQREAAEGHFRQALALGLDDGYLLAAYSDFLLDANRPADVITLLARWEASDSLLLRLAEARQRTGHPEATRLTRTLQERFDAARLRQDTTHRAEEARAHLNLLADPPGALQLALANHAVQREPRDARIVLEAALAARQPQAARGALDWLASSGFEDPRLRQLAAQLKALK